LLIIKQNPIRADPATNFRYFSDRLLEELERGDGTVKQISARLSRRVYDALERLARDQSVVKEGWPGKGNEKIYSLPKDTERDAAKLYREGGRKGGKARAAALTAEMRAEIARKAATARWNRSRNPKGDTKN
jgi:hypothetical protein